MEFRIPFLKLAERTGVESSWWSEFENSGNGKGQQIKIECWRGQDKWR